MVNKFMKMVEHTRVNTKMIRNTGRVFTLGLMVRSIMEAGSKASNMAKQDSQTHKVRVSTVFGRMEKGRNGCQRMRYRILLYQDYLTTAYHISEHRVR